MANNTKRLLIVVGIAVIMIAGIFGIIGLTENAGKTLKQITREEAMSDLDRMYSQMEVTTLEPVKEAVELQTTDMKDVLPDISKYPQQVENTTSDYVEIISSTEKAGTGKDGWLVEMAQKFNASGATVNGKPVSVAIRGIASGAAVDYIASGKYVPEAFSPSNELWGGLLTAKGIDVTLVEDRLAGNVAGIALSKEMNDAIIEKYGKINVGTIAEATIAGELAMGYTNPFASSTGANFLMSLLYACDKDDPLSDTATSQFEKFQANVPFVAYTTLQMKDSASSGVLGGFVFESQQFANSADLIADYTFTPFGMRHDNPVYEIGKISEEKQQILQQFIDFCKSRDSQQKATEYGFNQYDDYTPDIADMDGSKLSQAQKLWKDKKNSSKEIVAVFVADVSGSMDGEPLNNLKRSLLNGSNYINQDCSVGLVTFSDEVSIALPIGKFDLNQRSLFTGAVKSMSASGGTAMFDGIIAGEKMLQDAKADHPNAKLMLFVLTDGETNTGYTLGQAQNMIAGLKVPVCTIGYNADLDVLQSISSINEAASINADTEDVVYKITNLFNAEM